MESLRDLTVGITFNAGATITDINRLDKKIDDVGLSFSGMNAGINKAEDNIKDFGRTGQRSAGGLVSAFTKATGIVAGFFALDKIKDLGVGMVTASADAQAMNAQFDQVFGNIQDDAQETINQLGNNFGMIPNRIKPAMSQMTSMFKGLGMNTKDAMGTAEKAVTLVADAAAFYDKSFEDANSALNSFIKGNYEGGESIGLFANETQLAAWASKNLSLDWKKLDEAGKQVARLKYAEAMQKSAGATGQAARESDGLQNQLGNLKQTWQDLMAKLGENFLPAVISGIKSLSNSITNIDTQSIVSGFNSVKESLTPAFDVLKSGMGWVKDNWPLVRDGLIGLGVAVVSFKTIMTGMSIINSITGFIQTWRTATLAQAVAQSGLNATIWASPITWLVAGIAAVVAAGVLLWKNWDTVKAAAQALWDKVTVAFSGIKSAIGTAAGFIMDKMSGAWNFVKESAANALNSVIGGINKMIKTINKIPGVEIPLIAKVKVKKIDGDKADGSHAVGLARVPYNGYIGELHKDESVLTARQSNTLRSAGILSSTNDGRPELDFSNLNKSGVSRIEYIKDQDDQQESIFSRMFKRNAEIKNDRKPIDSPNESKINNNTVNLPPVTININHTGKLGSWEFERAVNKAMDNYFSRLLIST